MCVWALHARAADNKHLGYPSQAAFLTIGRATSAHADPTGYCAQDFAELDLALESLKSHHLGQFMAMMMYYKPWGIEACKAEGWPFGDSTYYKRLHAAHLHVSRFIDNLRNVKRMALDNAAEVE
jgi:hypothetical protein